MPEANVLYIITAVVVVALVVWVVLVLKGAKEPWARPAPAREAPEAEMSSAEPSVDDALAAEISPLSEPNSQPLNADETARATPVAIASESKAKAASSRSDD